MARVALVTGANRGIGFEVARQLARNGMTVFLGARNAALGLTAAAQLAAENLDVRYIELDLAREATVEAAARTIGAMSPHLDVLVNNAAIVDAADGPPSAVPLTVVRRLMEIELLRDRHGHPGHVAVTSPGAGGAHASTVSSGLAPSR